MLLTHCVLCWARLGNLRGFNSLYGIRAGNFFLIFRNLLIFLKNCVLFHTIDQPR
nr:MAG TPA: hypothetical protein [Caudoviricetes sp.]